MVNSLRQDQPVLGGRKLYHILKTKIHPDLDIGRDKFFDLLRDNGLLIRHSRVYRPVTTLSWNRFHKYPNLIKDYDPLSANPVSYTHLDVYKRQDLAPLHNPANLKGIDAMEALIPGIPQVAVFDTAFHQTMPAKAYMYGLPYEMYTKYGVRRYGFHGTSHRYVSRRACEILGVPYEEQKIITAHVGNGGSIAAVDHGKCVDTSMGLTPVEGLLMGTPVSYTHLFGRIKKKFGIFLSKCT